ncbi:MAG: hypothetical protein ACOYLB_14210 [Phototrophicaceae bacterium]
MTGTLKPSYSRMIPDPLIMGQAQLQRGSEIQAGARAEVIPSPLTHALSSFGGRVSAQMFRTFGFPSDAFNFIGARIRVLGYLMQTHVPSTVPHPILVDPVAGFSTLGYDNATAIPHGEHIDLNRQDTIDELERRLARAKDVTLPSNYKRIGVDYMYTTLTQAIGNRPVDVINANCAYFMRFHNFKQLFYLQSTLRSGGVCVAVFPSQVALTELQSAMRFFHSQVGQLPGAVSDDSEMTNLMRDAGYINVKVYRASELASEIGLQTPILDLELFAVGYKPKE